MRHLPSWDVPGVGGRRWGEEGHRERLGGRRGPAHRGPPGRNHDSSTLHSLGSRGPTGDKGRMKSASGFSEHRRETIFFPRSFHVGVTQPLANAAPLRSLAACGGAGCPTGGHTGKACVVRASAAGRRLRSKAAGPGLASPCCATGQKPFVFSSNSWALTPACSSARAGELGDREKRHPPADSPRPPLPHAAGPRRQPASSAASRGRSTPARPQCLLQPKFCPDRPSEWPAAGEARPVSPVLPTAPFTVPLGPGRLRFEPSQPDARGSDATCALAPTCLPRCMSQKRRENLQPRGKKKCLKDPLPRCDLRAGRRGPRGVRCRFPGRLALETEAARSSSAGTKDGEAPASGTGSRGERSCTRASSGKVEGGQLAPCERAFVNRLLK